MNGKVELTHNDSHKSMATKKVVKKNEHQAELGKAGQKGLRRSLGSKAALSEHMRKLAKKSARVRRQRAAASA